MAARPSSHASLFSRNISGLSTAGAFRRRTQPAMTPLHKQPHRHLNIHEYQSVELFKEHGIPTPPGGVATTPEEAESVCKSLKGSDFVVKAQVLSGGRGKGTFKNGFQGGVHLCTSSLEASALASKMLGQVLVTKQSGEEGKPCNKVFVGERMYFRRETYFAILMDRESCGPVMVASPAGGMNIEEVAEKTPELIFKAPIDIEVGPTDEAVEALVKQVGFDSAETQAQAVDCYKKLYELFVKSDCTLVEINPLSETPDGQILCCDAKLNFDDNAEYRQKEIFALRDPSQEDQREVAAAEFGLNYIGLDGSIGCLVNGAGLAMATMDAIKLYGGDPANFLDMGGGANKHQVNKAFGILNSDPQVKAILVNIFGGIMRCDVIALGMIQAAQELGIKKPIVIRLEGTKVEEALSLIDESGLRMLTAGDLGEAASKAVRVVDILRMAEKAKLDVSFELPL